MFTPQLTMAFRLLRRITSELWGTQSHLRVFSIRDKRRYSSSQTGEHSSSDRRHTVGEENAVFILGRV